MAYALQYSDTTNAIHIHLTLKNLGTPKGSINTHTQASTLSQTILSLPQQKVEEHTGSLPVSLEIC